MSKDKFLLFKANLTKKTDKLSKKPRRMKTIKNGQSFTLMSLDHSQHQVSQRAGECTLTDHSISKQDTQVEDSWIVSPTD